MPIIWIKCAHIVAYYWTLIRRWFLNWFYVLEIHEVFPQRIMGAEILPQNYCSKTIALVWPPAGNVHLWQWTMAYTYFDTGITHNRSFKSKSVAVVHLALRLKFTCVKSVWIRWKHVGTYEMHLRGRWFDSRQVLAILFLVSEGLEPTCTELRSVFTQKRYCSTTDAAWIVSKRLTTYHYK